MGKDAPLYEKGIKQNQIKPMETTVENHIWLDIGKGLKLRYFCYIEGIVKPITWEAGEKKELFLHVVQQVHMQRNDFFQNAEITNRSITLILP